MTNDRHKKALFSAILISLACSFPLAKAKTTYIPDGYHIETIALPTGVRFEIAGLDIDRNNNVYVATRFGDVWRYSKGKWNRFGQSLHEPTGLFCDKDGSVIVAHKPELTRLLDHDKDGVADDYIHLASQWEFHDNYHEFNFGPVKDKKGNLYGTLNLSNSLPEAFKFGAMGSAGGYRGWAYQVTTKGEFIPFASGLRSPAGIGISPKNEIFYTDNQGDWVETSKLHILEKGKFYGHPVSLRDHPDYQNLKTLEQLGKQLDVLDKMREKPVVWIPHEEVANSPGNPEWDTTKGKFGPFKGQIFIGDVTQSNIFRIILDKVNGEYQGAVINFIDGFQSGNIRTKFDQHGHLWVGQTTRGWGAKGKKPNGLQKVIWNGTMPFELFDIKLTKTGFKLRFTETLDASVDLEPLLSAEQWNYHYSANYGSPKKNLETLNISKVTLSSNKKSINIVLPLTENKVVAIDFSGIKSVSKREPTVSKVYYTLNRKY